MHALCFWVTFITIWHISLLVYCLFWPLKCKLLESKGLACSHLCQEQWRIHNRHLVNSCWMNESELKNSIYFSVLLSFLAPFLVKSSQSHFLPLFSLNLGFANCIFPHLCSIPFQAEPSALCLYFCGALVFTRTFIYIWYHIWSVDLSWYH